ncbi:MAG: hypothetical protein ACO1OK_00450 [Devosia sp.]
MGRLIPLWLSLAALAILVLSVSEWMMQKPYPVPFRDLPAEPAAFVSAMQPILATAFPDGFDEASLRASVAEWRFESSDGARAAYYLLYRSGCTARIGITWQTLGEGNIQSISGTRDETCF